MITQFWMGCQGDFVVFCRGYKPLPQESGLQTPPTGVAFDSSWIANKNNQPARSMDQCRSVLWTTTAPGMSICVSISLTSEIVKEARKES